MLWEVETDEYAATVKVEGLQFLRLERDSYGVEGSEFICFTMLVEPHLTQCSGRIVN